VVQGVSVSARAILVAAVIGFGALSPALAQVEANSQVVGTEETTPTPEQKAEQRSRSEVARLTEAQLSPDASGKTDWTSLLGPLGFGASGTDAKQAGRTDGTEQAVTGSSLSRLLAPRERYSLSWTGDGRLTLRFGMLTREAQLALPREEVQAGAYYQITPRLRVGGALKLKADEFSAKGLQGGEDVEADVRLESAFKF
jgi:hypothetical protein